MTLDFCPTFVKAMYLNDYILFAKINIQENFLLINTNNIFIPFELTILYVTSKRQVRLKTMAGWGATPFMIIDLAEN